MLFEYLVVGRNTGTPASQRTHSPALEALTEGWGADRVMSMAIKLDLAPNAVSGLQAQAEARGLSLEAYVTQLLESYGSVAQTNKLSVADRVSAFDEFVRSMEADVMVPDAAFHREDWYPDRG